MTLKYIMINTINSDSYDYISDVGYEFKSCLIWPEGSVYIQYPKFQ